MTLPLHFPTRLFSARVATLLACLSATSVLGLGACAETPPPVEDPDPSKLAAPLSGQGFQFRTSLFSVDAGTEVQDCFFYKVRDLARSGGLAEDQPVNLHRVEILQRKGSHHMNLFRVRTIQGLDPAKGPVSHGLNGTGECFNSANWADWPLIANTQKEGRLDWTFPDGVANVLDPDEWIMLQTHYVNASAQKSPDGGEVAVNFHTIPTDQVKAEMGTLFATKQSVRICKSNPNPSFSGTCSFKMKDPIHIVGANGHFHGRGKRFDMLAWDGTTPSRPADDARFYRSESWDDPPMLMSPELDLTVTPGSGVFFSCEYQWRPPADENGGCAALDAADKNPQKDCCYTFGPVVERNEHCNAFVYYWPKQDTDVFCN